MGNNINGIGAFKVNYDAVKAKLIQGGNSKPSTAQIIAAMRQNQAAAQDSVHFSGGEPQTKYMPPINSGNTTIFNDSAVQTKYMPPIFNQEQPQTKYMPPINQDSVPQTKYMPPMNTDGGPQTKYMPPVK